MKLGKPKPEENGAEAPELLEPGESTEKEEPQDSSVVTTTEGQSVEIKTITLEHVTLKGWEEDRKGIHTVHTADGIYNFKDGTAEILPEQAEALRKAGLIE